MQIYQNYPLIVLTDLLFRFIWAILFFPHLEDGKHDAA